MLRAYVAHPLRYKPEGLGFDSRCVIGIFHYHNPSVRTMALGVYEADTLRTEVLVKWRKFWKRFGEVRSRALCRGPCVQDRLLSLSIRTRNNLCPHIYT
jgi:hypothetical protein